MTNLDDMKRKIQGILALGNDAGATDAEAANAIAFARRLMLRHQLTDADLSKGERTAHEIAADTEYDSVTAWTEGAKMSRWEGQLALAVCELIGTVGCYVNGRAMRRTAAGTLEFDETGKPVSKNRVVFYGPAEDCRDAKGVFEEWTVLIASLARMKYGGAFRGAGRSYAEGFASALKRKLAEMKEVERRQIASGDGLNIRVADAAMVATGENRDTDCSAIVVIKSNEIMLAKKNHGTEWLRKEKGVRLSKRSSGSGGRHHSDAYAQGGRDGRRADFSRAATKKLS